MDSDKTDSSFYLENLEFTNIVGVWEGAVFIS